MIGQGQRRTFPWYRWLLRPLLFRLPPEQAQRLAETTLALRPVWRALGPRFRVRDDSLSRTVAGIHLDNPVGLAAGYDKQCQHLESLGNLGFGYVVGGTVTPDPRPGNAKPRLLRYPERQSLVNSMGFPSEGLAAVAARLRRLGHRPAPVFVSISALDEEGFHECHRTLEPLVEAVELNISSPNTQGLRVFQEPERLRRLLERLNHGRQKPLFVKLPPYTDNEERERVMAMLQVCVSSGVAGVTAINTVPVVEPRLATGTGGLSGKAIFSDMLAVVAELRREAGQELVINACGGIFTADDAWRALQAGADTVQLYTALVYRGPAVAREICAGLAQQLSAETGRQAGAGKGTPRTHGPAPSGRRPR